MKRSAIIIASACLLVLASLVFCFSDYMPGSIHQDDNGFMQGTGQWLYHYESGPVMLEEYYSAGRLMFSKWFRPDGSVVAATRWQNGDGIGYYLRQDGTIRTKMEYRNEKAHGPAVYYKEDGVTVDHIAEFRDGHRLEMKD